MILQYMVVIIAANCEYSSERDKLLVDERDSECHKALVVTVRCTRLMRLVR